SRCCCSTWPCRATSRPAYPAWTTPTSTPSTTSNARWRTTAAAATRPPRRPRRSSTCRCRGSWKPCVPASARTACAGCAPWATPPARRSSPVPASSWPPRSEEHTSELQSRENLVCRLLLEKKKYKHYHYVFHYPHDIH